MKDLVSVIFICFNNKKYIKSCLDSVLAQDYKKLELIFIDNNSNDKSKEEVKKLYGEKVKIIANKENLGYAKAVNQGIKHSSGELIWVMNLDIIFEKNYLSQIISEIKGDDKIAGICGKLYKYDFENEKKTKVIDSVGLYCFRNRRVVDYGQGLKDEGQFDEKKEIFGISGACPVYSKKALLKSAIEGEIIDEDFFMYKEDIDICWRLRLMGWNFRYLPKAIAYHGRGTGVLKRYSHLEVLKSRQKLSHFQKFYAYKNQRLMMLKNELWGNFFRDFFHIMVRETLIFGYLLIREPYLLKSFFKLIMQTPGILRKRRIIMEKKKVGAREMKKWLSAK